LAGKSGKFKPFLPKFTVSQHIFTRENFQAATLRPTQKATDVKVKNWKHSTVLIKRWKSIERERLQSSFPAIS